MTKPSNGEKRFSCLVAFIAGEAYSMYATFIAHALTAPDVHLVDRYSHQLLLPGQIGDIEVTVNWDDLLRVLLLSSIIFTLTWCAMRLTAKWRRGRTQQLVTWAEENRWLTATANEQGGPCEMMTEVALHISPSCTSSVAAGDAFCYNRPQRRELWEPRPRMSPSASGCSGSSLRRYWR